MAEAGVIVRTRDRPLTLGRTLRSVAAQTFSDWQICIVNDGGDAEALEAFVAEEAPREARITLVHHDRSLGRWPAANAGVAALDCRYLVIHDDDDSWDPRFLSATTEALSASDSRIGGVTTRVLEVYETIKEGAEPTTLRKQPFKPEVTAISIAAMAQANQIVPISFVYRRSLHDEVGLYDESLPVLGDWEFYLRILRHYDIALLDEALAYWHKRAGEADGSYGNSVIGRVTLHHETEARIRNRLLRQDMDAGVTGIGVLAATGQQSMRAEHFALALSRRLSGVLRFGSFFSRSRK